MDDIASRLGQLLNSQEGMQTLINMASALGLGANQNNGTAGGFAPPAPPPQNSYQQTVPQPPFAPPQQPFTPPQQPAMAQPVMPPQQQQDINGLANMLSGLLSGLNTSAPQTPPPQNPFSGGSPFSGGNPGLPNLDINTILGLQRAMSAIGGEDKNVSLLRSLRPIFSDTRQKKVDDAIKIMQLIKLLPLIKETGLFGGGDK